MILKYINFDNLPRFQFLVNDLLARVVPRIGKPKMFRFIVMDKGKIHLQVIPYN